MSDFPLINQGFKTRSYAPRTLTKRQHLFQQTKDDDERRNRQGKDESPFSYEGNERVFQETSENSRK